MAVIDLRSPPHRDCKHAFAFVSMFTIIILTYSNTFHASWHLDDEFNITENSHVQMTSLSRQEIWEALQSAPSSKNADFSRPLARLSFGLNYYFGKNEVLGYHIVNVLFHILSAFFLYLFLYQSLRLPLLKEKYGSHAFFISFWSAALWAIHPIQTQGVTYIVQRMTSMSGSFYIMAMYFYVQANLSEHKRTRALFLFACGTAGLAAFGAKENGILLPLSLFLFHVLLVERPDKKSFTKSLAVLSLFYLLPMFAGMAYLELSHDTITRIFELYDSRPFTAIERLLTEPRILLFYISLILYPMPFRLSADHVIPASTSLLDPPSTLVSILVVAAILIIASLTARKIPILSFSIFFFFLNHLLESSILPLELAFEHRNYIPSMLFFLPVAVGISEAFYFFSKERIVKLSIILAATLIPLTFGHAAHVRNRVWINEKTLWEDCLMKYPLSFRARINLGRYYTLRGEVRKAEMEFLRALRAPHSPKNTDKGVALFNLGFLAQRRGEHRKAISLYSEALKIDPCCPRVNNNIAVLLLEPPFADLPAGLRHLEKAIECGHPEEVPLAQGNLEMFLLKRAAGEEAVAAPGGPGN